MKDVDTKIKVKNNRKHKHEEIRLDAFLHIKCKVVNHFLIHIICNNIQKLINSTKLDLILELDQ